MRIGMDFGTTNSGIAAFDGEKINIIQLDPIAQSETMRSILYITREHELHLGQEAINLYNAQNINRERRMVQKKVGRIEMLFAEIGTVATDVHVWVDELEPGRLLRSLKTGLALNYTGTRIFDREYSLEEMISLYLRASRERASVVLNQDVNEVTLGRPVHFVGAETDADDQRAENRLRRAAQMAGFTHIDFEFEPVAAALHYAQSVTTPQNILVYDFGGGTLDLTVMHIVPGKTPEILSIGGVGIAGDRFDQRVVEYALTPHFGRDVTWGDKQLPISRTVIDQVTEWEGLSALATTEMRSYLHKLQADCSYPARLYALESLIFNFYGFALFESVEHAKRLLSETPFTEIRFMGEDIDIWQLITRNQFEFYTAQEWKQIRRLIQDVVARSGLRHDQIDAVVRTGGSSSIPISLRILSEIFGEEKLVTEDLFTGVTAGLGIKAFYTN